MNRTAQSFVPVAVMLGGCAPLPGMGPLFGPDALLSILLVVVVVLLGYLIKSRHDHRMGKTATSAEAILGERYARGEISRDVFLQMQRDIEHH